MVVLSVRLPIFPAEVRCDGCKHWEHPLDTADGVCKRLVAPESPVWVEGDIYTAPSFACNQWEPKS